MLYSGKNKSLVPVVICTLVYFLIGLIGVLNHEVWSDEAHHFLIAKESNSLPDLFIKIKYEGHPQLWSILLFIITRFTDHIFYMQLLNCMIMTTVCFLFLKHSRFNTLFNLLILCGYFFIYEYLVISRSYSLFLLALTLVFINLSEPKKPWKLYASLLFLSLTHVFGIIISVVICCMFLLKQFSVTRVNRYALTIIIAVNILILWSIRVPQDHFLFHYNSDGLLSYRRVSKTAGMFTKGFLPLADITEPIKWNSNFYTNKLQLAGVLIGFGIFLSFMYFLRKNRPMLLLYVLPCLCVYLFMHISPVIMSVRYCGIFFMLLIYIAAFLFTIITNIFFNRIIIAIIIIQAACGIVMYTADLQKNFSNAKSVAAYVKKNNLSNKPLLASNFSSAPAIACYLHKRIYYAETHEYGTYCKWNTLPFIFTNAQLATEIEKQVPPNDTLVIVLNQYYFHNDLNDTLVLRNPSLHYRKVKSFDNAMVNNENYFLFYVYSGTLKAGL